MASGFTFDYRISIHRSLAGPDPPASCCMDSKPYFNPQVPCGTRPDVYQAGACWIIFQSTGPLRDPTSQTCLHGRSVRNFNPQVPCGTRRAREERIFAQAGFQSTGPLRDPTLSLTPDRSRWKYFNPQVPCGTRRCARHGSGGGHPISIHRSLAGPDHAGTRREQSVRHFNPQVPCGTRLMAAECDELYKQFQSTGPLRDPTILTARPEKSP